MLHQPRPETEGPDHHDEAWQVESGGCWAGGAMAITRCARRPGSGPSPGWRVCQGQVSRVPSEAAPTPDPAPKPPSSMLIGLWSSLLAPRHTTLHPASPCWFDGLPASGHSSTCIQPCVCFGRCQMCHVARSSSRPVQSSMCPVGRCSTSHTPMHRRVVPCHWYTAEGLCRPPVGAVQTRRAWT